jgi:hypothetical protein
MDGTAWIDPTELTGRRSDLRARGVSDWALRGPEWRRTSLHGIWAPSATDPRSADQRIAEARLLLPAGAALGGWAAAYVHGAEELDGRMPYGDGLRPMPVCVGPGHRILRRSGIALSTSTLAPGDTVVIDGIPVLSLVRTAFDLGRSRDRETALSDIDALLRSTPLDLAELQDYAAAHVGWRGVGHLRWVASHASPWALSCPESILRYVWVVEAGLPAPLVNREVLDTTGRLLGVADLLDPTVGLAGEYDGRHHRRPGQRTSDFGRQEQFELFGLTVRRATGLSLFGRRRELVHRLRSGYELAVARSRGERSWLVGGQFRGLRR